MSRLGITGHQILPNEARSFVVEQLRAEIDAESAPVYGVTSLADGSDQLFADLVVRANGKLVVVVPCDGYESTFSSAGLRRYRSFLRIAVEVERLPFSGPTEEAFFAAGRRVVDLSDRLLAVWDGLPARGLGGTADVVRYARAKRKATRVIWPTGVVRRAG